MNLGYPIITFFFLVLFQLDGTASRRVKSCGDCKCGLLNLNGNVYGTDYILGGEEATPGEFPWMAHISIDGLGSCGGSLIGAQWVLTAAHCTHISRSTVAQPHQFKVIFGEHDSEYVDGPELKRKVSEVVNHPEYNKYYNLNADFALLKLEKPVDFAKHIHIRPICLPQTKCYTGESAIAAGWGSLSFMGDYPTDLQKVDLQIMSNEDCSDMGYGNRISNFMLCAAAPNEPEKDACQGDSGGPLITKGASSEGNYELAGVTSWGDKCGIKPGVYARVTEALSWIYETVGNNLNTCPRT